MATRVRMPLGGVLARIPRGVRLPEADWASRHRLLCAVLALHLPLLLGWGAARDGWAVALALTAFVGALLVLGTTRGGRNRSLSVTLGLLTCSAALVQLSGGLVEMHFHYFVVVALVALYQDWKPFALALAVVVAEAITGTGMLGATTDVQPEHSAWWRLLVHGGFVLAAILAQTVYWKYAEDAYAREDSYRRQLFDAEMGALARMREAGQLREDLIASVSHEFRTPLTAIRGSAATLRTHADRVRPGDRDKLLAGIVEHGERLSRLLEDMLTAASASAADPAAVADVSQGLQALAQPDGRPPTLVADTPPGLAAFIDSDALRQMLAALVDHGRDHARRERPLRLAAARDGRRIAITMEYESDRVVQAELDRLFEPFGSQETARTGRPTSLSLYVVRRLAEVHNGIVSGSVEDDHVRVVVSLRALRSARPAATVADPGEPGREPSDPPGRPRGDAPAPAAQAG